MRNVLGDQSKIKIEHSSKVQEKLSLKMKQILRNQQKK